MRGLRERWRRGRILEAVPFSFKVLLHFLSSLVVPLSVPASWYERTRRNLDSTFHFNI